MEWNLPSQPVCGTSLSYLFFVVEDEVFDSKNEAIQKLGEKAESGSYKNINDFRTTRRWSERAEQRKSLFQFATEGGA